jgi:transposase InsO family protein
MIQWRKPDWVVRELVRLKALMPDAGCRRLADVFNRRFAKARKMTVSKSYVAYTLMRERYAIEMERKRMRRKKPFNLTKNTVWAIDLTGKQDARGQIHSILGIIDHGTRRLLTLNAPVNKCAWTLLGHLFLAIGKYGKPKALRSDNEHIFTGKVFRLGLRLAGIRHQRTQLGCSWENGRIERLFGTLKNKLDQWCVADKAQLSRSLNIFAYWYNAIRPHQNINGRTPMEAWVGIDPYRSAPKQALWFEAWEGLLTGFYLRR